MTETREWRSHQRWQERPRSSDLIVTDVRVVKRNVRRETKQVAVGPDLVDIIDVTLDYISATRSRQENETKQMVVMPDLVVVMDASIVRSREDNETRQMAVSPALVVVLDVFFNDVSVDNEESETKQLAAP